MEELNYTQDIHIDEDALDLEALDQAELMLKYCEYEADAIKEMDEAKEKLEYTYADLDQRMRQNPDAFDLTKITDKSVDSAIKSNDEYRQAYEDFINAKHEANIAKGAVKAFDHRKKMIEILYGLHGQQYFAGPAEPRNLSQERNKRPSKKQSNKAVASKTRRRKDE